MRTADGGDLTRRPRGDLQRHADPALRRAARRPRRPRARLPVRPRRRCRSTSRSPSRRAGRATSVSGETAIVHLTPGLDGVSRAVNEADRGLLPAEATVVVGQPLTMDASRAPEGKGLLWIQLQELPWRVKGDAAGELDGDRRQRRRQLDGGAARALRRPDPGAPRAAHPEPRVLDPRAHVPLARRSLVGEHEPRAAATPTAARSRSTRTSSGAHRTARRSNGVWHVGASTHPGPGLGGGSGALVAAQLLEEPLTKRVAARFRR